MNFPLVMRVRHLTLKVILKKILEALKRFGNVPEVLLGNYFGQLFYWHEYEFNLYFENAYWLCSINNVCDPVTVRLCEYNVFVKCCSTDLPLDIFEQKVHLFNESHVLNFLDSSSTFWLYILVKKKKKEKQSIPILQPKFSSIRSV